MIFRPPLLILAGHDGDAVLDQDAVVFRFPRRYTTSQVKSARSPRRIPLIAVTEVEHETGRRPHLRLRLAGTIPGHEPGPPQRDIDTLLLDPSRRAENEAFVAELRTRLVAHPVPEPRLLAPDAHAPGLPPVTGPLHLSVSVLDGVVTVDGQRVLLEFNSTMRKPSRHELPLTALRGVELVPAKPHRSGLLRFLVEGARPHADPRRDPHTVRFMAGTEEGRITDLAAELAARLAPSADRVLIAGA
ncbi:hypothetical protein JOF53_007654 [Crossiella equi]|uniref:DUF4429 domain-containing protein n=1 Tax=Crossiella equi TaxID=130796 RepID=A0ABS5AQV8_9PSEU|nr:DUF4429 domain-containing protein [Crossiella equi]MBP2478782.1 hypothetical protein [Crossiella equi]